MPRLATSPATGAHPRFCRTRPATGCRPAADAGTGALRLPARGPAAARRLLRLRSRTRYSGRQPACTDGIAVLVGHPEKRGQHCYNAATLINDGAGGSPPITSSGCRATRCSTRSAISTPVTGPVSDAQGRSLRRQYLRRRLGSRCRRSGPPGWRRDPAGPQRLALSHRQTRAAHRSPAPAHRQHRPAGGVRESGRRTGRTGL
jgi:hypothetical protein